MQFENRSLFDDDAFIEQQQCESEPVVSQSDQQQVVIESVTAQESITVSEEQDGQFIQVHSEVDVVFTTDRLNDQQMTFIDEDEWWKNEWKGMPEFIQADGLPWKTIYVHFRSHDDLKEFSNLLQQQILTSTPSIWYPPKERRNTIAYAYVNES